MRRLKESGERERETYQFPGIFRSQRNAVQLTCRAGGIPRVVSISKRRICSAMRDSTHMIPRAPPAMWTFEFPVNSLAASRMNWSAEWWSDLLRATEAKALEYYAR